MSASNTAPSRPQSGRASLDKVSRSSPKPAPGAQSGSRGQLERSGGEDAGSGSIPAEVRSQEYEDDLPEDSGVTGSGTSPPPPPPNFGPYFSLVEDAQSGEHHHPSVHYVFADDDADPITAVSVRALGEKAPRPRARHHVRRLSARGEIDPPSGEEEAVARSGLPEPPAGKNERYIIVDVAEDGQTILNARSLSRRWAVTNAKLEPAPILAGINEGEEKTDSGMMLKIEGTEVKKWDGKASKMLRDVREARDGDLVAAMDDLVQRIRAEMGVLEKIVGEEPAEANTDEPVAEEEAG